MFDGGIIMELKTVKLEVSDETNIIFGQSHFIKSVEDLYEIMVTGVPGGKFGLAFNEASGPCLVRAEGNDEELKSLAIKNIKMIGAGHTFIILSLCKGLSSFFSDLKSMSYALKPPHTTAGFPLSRE